MIIKRLIVYGSQWLDWHNTLYIISEIARKCREMRENAVGSIRCRVIAQFVSNFVPIATRVSRGKMRFAAFNGPSSKIPLQTQKSRRYFLHKPSYRQFCPKFRCHGNGSRSGKNAIGSIRWPIPPPKKTL